MKDKMSKYYGPSGYVEPGSICESIEMPIEPTDEMLKYGIKTFQHTRQSDDVLADWRAFYKACIDFEKKAKK